jgi:hypothetical protein
MRARDFLFEKRLIENPQLDAFIKDAQVAYGNAIYIMDVECAGPHQINDPIKCATNKQKAEKLAAEIKKYYNLASSFKKEKEDEFQRGAKQGYKGGVEKGTQAQKQFINTNDEHAYRKVMLLIKRFSGNLAGNDDFVLQVRSIFDRKGLTPEEVDIFLDGALGLAEGKKSVINMSAAVKKSSGNLNDHVYPEYKKVFKEVSKGFMALQDPTAQRGSIGPTEIALILLGNPTSKADKGDLEIDGKHYEVKASKSTGPKKASKSGGRLTADSMPKNNTIKKVLLSLIKKHFELTDEELMVQKTKKSKAVKPAFNLGISGITFINDISKKYGPGSDWNTEIIRGKRKGKKRNFRTRDRIGAVKGFLYEFLATVMPGTMADNKTAKPIIDAMVNKDGSLDTGLNDNFFRQYMKANWIEYKGSGAGAEYIDDDGKIVSEHGDHFDALMFINRESLQYHIVKSGDELVDAIKDGSVSITKGGTFTDAQNPAAPQLYSA